MQADLEKARVVELSAAMRDSLELAETQSAHLMADDYKP